MEYFIVQWQRIVTDRFDRLHSARKCDKSATALASEYKEQSLSKGSVPIITVRWNNA